jgi:hypothetical protein
MLSNFALPLEEWGFYNYFVHLSAYYKDKKYMKLLPR